MTCHVITYGDTNFGGSKRVLAEELSHFGKFKTIKTYGPEDLTPQFRTEFKDILSLPRGGGYWIWKVNIIQQRLNEVPDGDVIMYIDAGCKINDCPAGHKEFRRYLELVSNSKSGLLVFQMSLAERNWTTKEIFNYFNLHPISSLEASSGQISATLFFIKKCPQTLDFFDAILKCYRHNPLLLTDHYNQDQSKDFKENRHDQSIFSLFCKTRGVIILPSPRKWELHNCFFWASRRRIAD